jgi:hypothetical protein
MPNGYTPGGGLSAGWQPPLTPEQEQERDVQKLLFQYGKPYSQQYQEWSEEHPVQTMALETATNLIPYARIAKRIPGLQTIGSVIEMAEKVGGLHDWGGSVAHIKDPKLEFKDMELVEKGPKMVTGPGEIIGTPKSKWATNVYEKATGENVGRAIFTVQPKKKEIYLDWAGLRDPGKFGTGQLKHLSREMSEQFPEMETMRFMRISGAGPTKKGYLEEVSVPIKRGTGKGVTRRRISEDWESGPEEFDPVDREALWLAEQGVLDYQMPEADWQRAVRQYGEQEAGLLERRKTNALVADAVRRRRQKISEEDPNWLDPEEAGSLGEYDYRRRLNDIEDRLTSQAAEHEAQIERIMARHPSWETE